MSPSPKDIVAAEVHRLSRGALVEVSLNNGVATLTGQVPNEARRRLIEQGLLQLPEIDDVRNFVRVTPPLGDIQAQLESLIEREGVVIHGLHVTAAANEITLSGRADGWFDRDAAERLAWSLSQVKTVVNRIVLKEGAVTPETDEELPT